MKTLARFIPGPATRGLLAVTLLLIATACTLTVDHEPARSERRSDLEVQVDELAGAFIDAGETAGISVAVARDGRVVLAKGYGLADIENDVPATADTVYRIGSITKQFTAAAIMRLVEEGELALDTDLATLLPDFPTEGHAVTVEQLLNHTSGIPSYTSLGDAFWSVSRLDLTHDELLALVNEPAFDFAPGTEWRYNNTGYYLLGLILERLRDRDYAAVMRDEIFEPLGLEATTYCGEREIIPHRAEGYEREDGRLLNDEMLSMDLPYAAGALCSTVGDLIAWQQALAAGEFVSASSYEAMITPRTLADGSPLTYGFGLGIDELEGHPRIAHGGGINGFVSMLARYPEDALDVVVLTNTGGPVAGKLADRVARAALGIEIPEFADLPVFEEQAEQFVGTYDLGDLQLEIRWREDRLWAQAPGQQESRLRYQGEGEFVPDFDDRARLLFDLEQSPARSLTLLQGGAGRVGERVEGA